MAVLIVVRLSWLAHGCLYRSDSAQVGIRIGTGRRPRSRETPKAIASQADAQEGDRLRPVEARRLPGRGSGITSQ